MKAGSGWVWGIAIVVVVFAALGGNDSALVEGSPEWCAANGLSASACDDLHTIVDVFGDSGSPGPTFADGSAIPPEVVAAGELCSILHPSDDVAFVECVFRKSAPPARELPERAPSVTSPSVAKNTPTTPTTSGHSQSTTTVTAVIEDNPFKPPTKTQFPTFLESGLGVVYVGEPTDIALRILQELHGEPNQDSGWIDPFTDFGTCPTDQARQIIWGSLDVVFVRSSQAV